MIYTARLVDDTPPRQEPDEESLGAAWARLQALTHLPLRSVEVAHLLTEIANGAPMQPRAAIACEGSSLRNH